MFQGLSTALTALYANQKALDTTGNNIANVNTEGYSRQQVITSPTGGSLIPSFWSNGPRAGTGVNVDNIVRLRDAFLDNRSLTEHGTLGALTQTKTTYDAVELTFKEPSDTGILSQLDDYWQTWDDVATNPTDGSARIQVVEQANTLVTGIQQAASDLDELEETTLTGLKNDVKQVNSWAKSIGDLNVAIQAAYQSGTTPNNLLDQRDLLISKMSDFGAVTVKETQNGSVSVSIGGISIVRDKSIRELQVDDSGTPVVLRWDQDGDPNTTTDGTKAVLNGGKLAGHLTSLTTIIPKYRGMLDDFATNLISTVNTQHAAGMDQYGNPGAPFFTGTSAKTIAVNTAIVADPKLLAAASAGGGEADEKNAAAMAKLAESLTGPNKKYEQLINTLGVESQRTSNQYGIQAGIVQTVDNARDSVSSVSLDEEMTNMIKYQKAYSASAKYLNVMNDVMDQLINLVR
jgi:flagellar hook-associated protein FlgK